MSRSCVCLLSACLVATGGCGKSDEEKALAAIRSGLISGLAGLEDPSLFVASSYDDFLDREYVLGRKKATIDFLEGRRTLSKPYMVMAELGPADEELKAWPELAVLYLDWLGYRTRAEGVVLYYKEKTFRLPIFAHPLWGKELKEEERGTVYRIRKIALLRSDGEEPQIRISKSTGSGTSSEILFLPRGIWQGGVRIAVYDNEGNLSNDVELFVWPEDLSLE